MARPKSGANFECQRECRLALAKAKDDVYNPDAPALVAAEGHPYVNKRAKAARGTIPAVERLQSSIELCIADAKSNAAKREEKSKARWLVLMNKKGAKLDLLRTNFAVKKRNTNLAFLMGADVPTMDEHVKDC
ncbi:putative methionyl-tRNA synthetase [Hordeum vulgare]|nr:putative methionyl-tRNA synthetase [Hordeum vulgare]